MVGIVLVSHSAELASGLAQLVGQIAGPEVPLIGVGGDADGGLGTDPDRIEQALGEADRGQGVAVLVDIGSAVLAIQDLLAETGAAHVRLVDAPLVEGAVAAAAAAMSGATLDAVVTAAEEARGIRKL